MNLAGVPPLSETPVEPHAAPAVGSDHTTFERFYAENHRSLTRLAYVLTGSRSNAEELVQETMLRVLMRWRRVAKYDQPGAWARRVLLNLATSRGRRRAVEARAMLLLRGAHRDARSPAPSPDQVATFTAIARLPRRQAQVVALRFVDDLSVPAIATLLDIPEGTVKSQLHRARIALARELNEEDA